MVRWARSPRDAVLVLVAAARGLGHDPQRLRPREALAAWAQAAQVPFRVPPVPDADGLLYRFGVQTDAGERRFHLELLRRLACRDSDGHCEVLCDVRLPATPELEALGSHAEWCFEPPASPARHTWTRALGDRPEWALLERLAPVEVAIGADDAVPHP